MMNFRERTKEIVWYLATAIWLMIAFSIAYIWMETLISHQKDVIKYLSLELALLVLLALIAGFEIAFTDLRDKDPLQLDPKLRRLLTEMQQNESVVYDAREWFGVVLIVLISLICEFDPVFEPHFDTLSKFVSFRIDPKTWKFVITLLFTTFPVVWFAQGPAKHFAIRNSERFLMLTRFLWPLFKFANWIIHGLALNSISDLFFGHASKKWSRQRRNLPPSEAAFYVSSLKRYGHGIYHLQETATIFSDGSAEVRHTGIIHVVAGEQRVFVRKQFSDAPFVKGEVQLISAFYLPAPEERIDAIQSQVEKCFMKTPLAVGYTEIPVTQFSLKQRSDPTDPKQISYEIRAPFALAGQDPPFATILKYQTITHWGPDAYKFKSGESDAYRIGNQYPFRFSESVWRFDKFCRARFANPTVNMSLFNNDDRWETNNVVAEVNRDNSREMTFSIKYPLPGAFYGVEWEVWEA